VSSDRWERVQALFAGALERPPDQRAAYVAAGAEDPAVIREVLSLLEAHEGRGQFDSVANGLQGLPPAAASVSLAKLLEGPGTALAGRYAVERELGRGGMATVYLARDLKHDRPVAVKVLRPEIAAILGAERFLREIQIAARLQHPHILALYDSGDADGTLYYVMPYVEGQSLRDRLDREGPLPLEDALLIAADVAEALRYAHAHDVVHRDIKPENILLVRERAVVVDFGIARAVTQAGGERLTATGIAVGTPVYMSPEQAGAEPRIDGRSDIYSLGCVVYEMLAGHPPFTGSTAREILARHSLDAVPSLRAARRNLPEALEAAIGRALAKAAADRFATATQFAEALRGGAETPPPTTEPAPDRRTVGRDRERRELRLAFEEAAAGRGVLISVVGEPGIGKTTLVEEFLSELSAASRSTRIARGRCSERLAGTEAYLPLLEALDSLTRGPARDPVTSALKRLAPTWYLQIAPATTENSSEARALVNVQASSQERMKRELAAFFDELCRPMPLVLFFDDLHWADVSTVDVLGYIASRLGSLRLLMVVTVRQAELLVGKHPFAQLKLDLQARSLCRELALDFLTVDDVAQFLALEFPEHKFPSTFAALIHDKTEGSPLFMVDLLRYLRTRGIVSSASGSWVLAESMLDVAHTLPESTRGMIQRKIEQLGGADRKLLAAASVQGAEFDSAVVARLVGVEPAEVEERLEVLEHVYGFVRRAREHELPDGTLNVRYRFVHGLYQNALYASLTPTRRASLSGVAAQSLLEFHAAGSTQIATDLALLFETARDTTRAVEYLSIAANNAARVFAYREAVALARRGLQLLEHLPESSERVEREMTLQAVLGVSLGAVQGVASPDVGRAHGRAYELWKQLGSRPELFAIVGGLWTHYVVAGKFDIALGIGEELLRMAEAANSPAMVVAAGNCLGITLHHLGDHRRALEYFERASEALDVRFRTAFLGFPWDPGVNLVAQSSRVLWVLGYPDRALARMRDALALADRIGHPESRAFASLFGAYVHQFRGEVAEALEYAETMLALSREWDIATTLAWGMSVHGWATGMRGQMDEGIAEIRESLAIQRGAGSEVARPQFLAMLAEVCAVAERYDEALAAAGEGLQVSSATSNHYWDSELRRFQGEALLRLGRGPAEAEAHFVGALADARNREAKSLELRVATSLARLWTEQGKRVEARELLAPICEWFTEGLETADLVVAKALLVSLA